jgi:hypothetical protein
VLGLDYDSDDEKGILHTKTVHDVCKKKWNDMYRAVTATKKPIKTLENNSGKYTVTYDDGTIEKYNDLLSLRVGTAPDNWDELFEEHFVLESAIFFALFTERYTMVDNRAKNSFWHFGKCNDQGDRKWDLCFDYDNDTALGIDNAGLLTYGYGYNDQDLVDDDPNTEVFRARKSTFFCRLKQFYDDSVNSAL